DGLQVVVQRTIDQVLHRHASLLSSGPSARSSTTSPETELAVTWRAPSPSRSSPPLRPGFPLSSTPSAIAWSLVLWARTAYPLPAGTRMVTLPDTELDFTVERALARSKVMSPLTVWSLMGSRVLRWTVFSPDTALVFSEPDRPWASIEPLTVLRSI